MLKNGLIECCGCGRRISPTSGTLLHGTRKSVGEWFHAMWWISTQKTGDSTRELQRLLEFGGYQTAWGWLHKLKTGMVGCVRDPLQGPVEVDDAFLTVFQQQLQDFFGGDYGVENNRLLPTSMSWPRVTSRGGKPITIKLGNLSFLAYTFRRTIFEITSHTPVRLGSFTTG